ncbi:MAG: T9SS type A sorting domain-containing protein [Bacteroidota bacterium]
MRTATIIIFLSILTSAHAVAQNTAVLWSAFDQGFAVPTSSRTSVKSVAGQAFIGFTQSSSTWHEAGFLADTLLRGTSGPPVPVISFRRTYGGNAVDVGYSLQQTSDRGFIIAGLTTSFAGAEAYLVKTAENGVLQWQKNFHYGTTQALLQAVTQTSDGGYAAAGWSVFVPNTQIIAFYLVKTNSNGDTLWSKVYPFAVSGSAAALQQTTDGGYIMAGEVNSQMFVMKTTASGDTMWVRTFPGNGQGHGTSVQQTSDGGFIVLGWGHDSFIRYMKFVKLDSTGATQWLKTFGETNYFSYSGAVRQTIDGGYIISGDYAAGVGGGSQAYLIKTNAVGDTTWTRRYFTPGYHSASSVSQAFDGGYIVAGVAGPNANVQDAFLMKTNENGDSVWAQIFGGGGGERATSVVQTSDGGYAFTGETNSSGAGLYDVWLVKSDATGFVTSVHDAVHPTLPTGFELMQNYPNPFNPTTTIEYALPLSAHVELRVYNILGQEVTTLVNEVQTPGYHKVKFDASSIASGVYFYRLQARLSSSSVGGQASFLRRKKFCSCGESRTRRLNPRRGLL